jgi:hypothetical protein
LYRLTAAGAYRSARSERHPIFYDGLFLKVPMVVCIFEYYGYDISSFDFLEKKEFAS